MAKILKFLLLAPVAIIVLVLAIANRAPVTLALDPVTPADPMFFLRAPFFVFLLAALILGILIGGIAMWFSQGKHRKSLRQVRGETQRIKTEMADIKSRNAAPANSTPALMALPK